MEKNTLVLKWNGSGNMGHFDKITEIVNKYVIVDDITLKKMVSEIANYFAEFLYKDNVSNTETNGDRL